MQYLTYRALAIVSIAAALSACGDSAATNTAPLGPSASLETEGRIITMTDLGTLGGQDSEASAINNFGQIVGYAQIANGDHHAFMWENGVMTDLGTLGVGWSDAHDINDAGRIVGQSGGVAMGYADGKMYSLASLYGKSSAGNDLNDRGLMVGSCTNAAGALRACLWEGRLSRDIGSLGELQAAANAVNNRGQVVGVAIGVTQRAFLWRAGVMTELRGLGGVGAQQARDINDAGVIVGYSVTANGRTHATAWRDRVPFDLGTLDSPFSSATAVNDIGQIVGFSQLKRTHIRAFLWEKGKMIDLGALSGLESVANDINNNGQIVGSSGLSGGARHAVLWTITAVERR